MKRGEVDKGEPNMEPSIQKASDRFVEDAITMSLRRFGESFYNSRETVSKFRRVVSSALINITRHRIESARGGPVTLPVGQRVRVRSSFPLNGLVLVAVEESGFMTDEDLLRISKSFMNTNLYHRVGVLAVSAESDVFNGSFSFFLQGETKPSRFEIKRRTSTQHAFHRVLLHLDAILGDIKHPMHQSLAKTLGECDTSQITVEHIAVLYERGKVAMIIVTDGCLNGDDFSEAEHEKIIKYVATFKDLNWKAPPTPIVYIFTTTNMTEPIRKASGTIYRIMRP